MKKFSPEKKCIIILAIFNISALIIFIPISAVFNLWGLTLGWAIGTSVTFINMMLLFKTGDMIADQAKDNHGTALSVLFYFVRFTLVAGAMVLCACLHWLIGHYLFIWSLFTCAASVLPSTLIITIFYHSDNTEEKKIEKK